MLPEVEREAIAMLGPMLTSEETVAASHWVTIVLIRALVNRGSLNLSDVRFIIETLRKHAGGPGAEMHLKLADFLEMDFRQAS